MSDTIVPTPSDRAALYLSIGVAAIGAVATIATTIARLVEVAPGKDVPVTVQLEEQTVGLPLGPNGALVDASVDTATIVVPHAEGATLFALWAQPIWLCLCVLAGLALAAMFFLRVARGQIFTKRASRLALYGALVVGAAWLGSGIFTAMAMNGALATVSDGTWDSGFIVVSFTPFLAILLLGGLGGALDIGERLQRDNEGLV
ncbi:hypothetical protein [Demequina sp.]|uniref:hypothetical protein n=1 Tax=Demequina sp. TaxID=2050685 RepID=UPI003D133F5A